MSPTRRTSPVSAPRLLPTPTSVTGIPASFKLSRSAPPGFRLTTLWETGPTVSPEASWASMVSAPPISSDVMTCITSMGAARAPALARRRVLASPRATVMSRAARRRRSERRRNAADNSAEIQASSGSVAPRLRWERVVRGGRARSGNMLLRNDRTRFWALVTPATPYSCLQPRSSLKIQLFGKAPCTLQAGLQERIERIGFRDHHAATDPDAAMQSRTQLYGSRWRNASSLRPILSSLPCRPKVLNEQRFMQETARQGHSISTSVVPAKDRPWSTIGRTAASPTSRPGTTP